MPAAPQRLQAVVANYSKLLIASRNLDFFTSFYRFLIQLLPAAVVAPLFFAGKLHCLIFQRSVQSNPAQCSYCHLLAVGTCQHARSWCSSDTLSRHATGKQQNAPGEACVCRLKQRERE